MKLKSIEQFESKDPCGCGGNCGCGKSVNEKFSFSKKEVEAAANLIASAISKADKVKAEVHDLEYDKGRGAGFDISIDGEEFEGGSYVVKDNGDVVNAAIGNSHPNAVYSTIGNKDIADVFANMAKYESNTITEAKKYKFKDLAKAWEFVYGEEMEDEYQGFYQEVTGKYKDKVTKADIAKIWNEVYGEDIATEYEGFFSSIKEAVGSSEKLEQFNLIEEANADGTISDDEDDRLDDLLGDVEMQIDELIQYARTEAYEIGGDFRGPGMTSQVKKLMLDKLKRMKK